MTSLSTKDSDAPVPVPWPADETLELLPLYDEPPRTVQARGRSTDRENRPTVILRTGGADVAQIAGAAEALRDATGLVVNLTERDATVRVAKRVARQHGMALIGDPVLFRMALPGHAGTPGLRHLRYRPSDGGGPWSAADLRSHARKIARRVVEEQQLAETDAVMGASVTIDGPDDPRLAALPVLLHSSLAARSAWGQLPVIAPLMLRMRGFSTHESRLALDEVVKEVEPQAWLLVLDGLSMQSSAKRVLSAIELARGLDARGVPVLIGNTGPLRRLWLALGYGVELALGRHECFRISDYTRGPREKRDGPRHTPARWEVPELLCSLPQHLVARVIASGLIEQCSCQVCAEAGSIKERMVGVSLHNATVCQGDIAEVRGSTVVESLERLQARLQAAHWLCAELRSCGIDLGNHVAHLERWPEVCAAVLEMKRPLAASAGQLRLAAR